MCDFRLDFLLTVLLLLMFLAVSKDTYTRYVEHLSKKDLVEPCEWLLIVLMAANVVIVYVVYSLARQYGRIQNLSQLVQQREFLALFYYEIELTAAHPRNSVPGPSKGIPGSGSV